MEIKKEPIDLDNTEIQKTNEIILREFEKEISERENDVIVIQEKIQLTQRYLKILSYVASYGYYQGDDVKKTESEETQSESAIHPCVQRLLPSKKELKPEISSGSSCSDVEVRDNVETTAINVESPTPGQSGLKIVRGTVRMKHTLVVGNVSKWIPPEFREDQATHKWMLYVRDKNKDDELGSLIQKVRYFLHESYKPHDIIDVTSAPFHLTRRGWGEFPVRVKIFFNHPSNKPIDFVHQLRLDQTMCRSQMLGGETQIEIDLYQDNADNLAVDQTSESPPKRILSTVDQVIATEHDYCVPHGKSDLVENAKPVYQPQLITSLSQKAEASELSVLENFTPDSNITASEWYMSNIRKRAENIYFLTTEACVRWFLKRWPIITASASNSLYKSVHAYCFPTWQSYITSNIGKRHAAEWFRASKIKQMLESLHINPWSTKQIMLYARMFGYTVIIEKQHNLKATKRFKNISTYTSQVDTTRDLRQLDVCHQDEEIDIIDENNSILHSSPSIKRSQHCVAVSNSITYVNSTVKEIGVKLKEEEVIPGTLSNASSQILSKVLKLFIDDLLRKSLANAWLRNACKNPASLEVEDVIKTLVENPEFDIFTNNGLGSKESTC